jgi:hypothetical protein
VTLPQQHGRKYSKMMWSQTTRQVLLRVLLPPHTRAAQLEVTLAPTHLRVLHRPTNTLLLDHDLG